MNIDNCTLKKSKNKKNPNQDNFFQAIFRKKKTQGCK